VAVKVRRKDWFKGDKWPKYYALKGGGDGCLVLGKVGLPVFVVESELDAYLLAQDAAGLCSVVALGSAANHPDTKTAAFIRQAPAVFYSLDYDAPGRKPFAWWKDHFSGIRVCPPVVGKDLGDMVEAGVSLADWVSVALEEEKPLPAWEEICPKYYHGCFSCEYMNPDDVTFCMKYQRNGELIQ
ncbi:toprim domain-containing protein, partial [Desulfovibrio sp. OttesenSCG-928-G15]|nr:toprim domain-containing protein [Desulfovibrio sp. OttesenSCG-928-G15]